MQAAWFTGARKLLNEFIFNPASKHLQQSAMRKRQDVTSNSKTRCVKIMTPQFSRNLAVDNRRVAAKKVVVAQFFSNIFCCK